MSVTSLPEDEVQSVRVRLDNRVFPTAGRPAKGRAEAIYQLQPDPDPRDPQRVLAEAIWQRLPWAKASADVDRTALVQAYVGSLEELARFRADVDRLVRATCRASIEFRQASGRTHGKSRDAAMQKKLDQLVKRASRAWSSPVNVLDAQLVSQSTGTIRERLDEALRQATGDFASQFYEHLAHLVDHKLAGLVEWLPHNCCRYHFFKEVLIQHYEGSSRTVREETVESEERDPVTGRRLVGRRITEDTDRGHHVHRHARHEHHVMNAFRTTLGNSRVVVPPNVERLIRAIPEWLYPQVEMIDGDIFRERIIEQDYSQEVWQEVRVKDEPIYGCEPGVIIGPYVLTGWGPREVAAEQVRRAAMSEKQQRDEASQVARWRSPVMQVAAAIFLFLGLVLLMRSFQASGSIVFALLATATGLVALHQGMVDRATLQNASSKDPPLRSCAIGSLALVPQALLAVWFGAGSWGWLMALLLLAGSIACWYRVWRLR
jgi:hypothetical protein